MMTTIKSGTCIAQDTVVTHTVLLLPGPHLCLSPLPCVAGVGLLTGWRTVEVARQGGQMTGASE